MKSLRYPKSASSRTSPDRPLKTPSPPDTWRPPKKKAHLRNRLRLRERTAADALYMQVAGNVSRYVEVFGSLAPPAERLLRLLGEALYLERERRYAKMWLEYVEDASQRAWTAAADDVRLLAAVYAMIERVRGKPAGFDAVPGFKHARSVAAEKAAATKKAKRSG